MQHYILPRRLNQPRIYVLPPFYSACDIGVVFIADCKGHHISSPATPKDFSSMSESPWPWSSHSPKSLVVQTSLWRWAMARRPPVSECAGEGNTENCWGFLGSHSWTKEQSWVFHIFPVLKGWQLPFFSKWEFTNLKITQKQQILAWMCCSPEVTMICPSDLHVAPEIYSSRKKKPSYHPSKRLSLVFTFAGSELENLQSILFSLVSILFSLV